MCCCVVEEMDDFRGGFFGGFGLLQGYGAEGGVHGGINGSSVVEEGACDLHNLSVAFGWKGCRSAGRWSDLLFGSIYRFCPWVGSILSLGQSRMLEFVKGGCDVAWHGQVDCSVDVVPFECNPTMKSPVQSSTRPVYSLMLSQR